MRNGRTRTTRQIAVFAAFLLCPAVSLRSQDGLASKSKLAKAAMDAGRFPEAVAIYRDLVRALPDNPGLRLDLGLALHLEGKYREAVDQFQIAVRGDPGIEPAWLMMGLDERKLDQTGKAVEALERALRIQADDKRAQLELADAYLTLGRAKEAARGFEALTKTEPANPKAWQGLGLSDAALGRSAFAELEKIGPDSAFRDALLGQSLLDQHQDRSAFYWYRQALAKNDHLPGAHAALAEVYRRAGHNDWAAIEEDRERRLPEPDCSRPEHHRDAAECDFLAGRFSQVASARAIEPVSYYWQARAYGELALEAFRRLTALPPSSEVHELMAEAFVAQGNYQSAAQELNEALKLAPGDAHLEQGLARALWLGNDFEKAEPLLRRLVQNDPESAELTFELGDTLLEAGSAEKAVPWLETAVRLAPSLGPAQAALGLAYLRSGRPGDAVPHLKAALPSDQTGATLYQLAQAYRQSGQTKLANQAMRELDRSTGAALARTQRMDQERVITAP